MTQQSMAKTLSFGVSGVNGFPVQVEVFCVDGMPMMEIIGLPDTSVRESKNRINAAILSSGIELPVSRVTFNLAPADIRKEGPSFDLPMAVGLLIASNRLSLRDEYDPDHTAFFGRKTGSGKLSCPPKMPGKLPASKAFGLFRSPICTKSSATWTEQSASRRRSRFLLSS